MPDTGALLLILAVAFPPQEGARPAEPAQGEPEWVGPKAPTRGERAAQDEARRVREERAKRAAAASARLAVFEVPISKLWLEGRPSLSRQRGLPPLDLTPLELGGEARRTWRRGLQKAKGDLEGIDWPDLDATRRLDRDWLGAFLEAELALAALEPERGNPLGTLEELESVLSGLLAAGGLGPDARMQILTMHLAGLPEALLGAQGELVHPDREACEQGVLVADDLLLLLQTRMTPRLAAAGPRPGLWKPFEDAQAAAERAVQGFRAWLGEEAKRDGATPVLGAGGWLHVAGALVGGELELEALKVRLLRDIAALDASLGTPAASPAAATAADLTPSSVADRLRAAQMEAWLSARALQLVDVAPPPIGCALWTAGALPGAPLELHYAERPVLVVVPRGAAWLPSAEARRLTELGPDAQRARALMAGFPGEALWELWSRQSTRTTERVFWNRAQREGFGLWAADWATRPARAPSALAGDAALSTEVRRIRRLEAARLYAALELHAGGASLAETARDLMGFAHLDVQSAAYEARLALLDPLRGIGYLGYLELLAAEEALSARMTSPELALWWVARLVRLAPSAPIRASVARMGELEPLLGPEAPEPPAAPAEPAQASSLPPEGGEGR